jgi:hypothetical protein
MLPAHVVEDTAIAIDTEEDEWGSDCKLPKERDFVFAVTIMRGKA